ncbi:MAG: OmcA/MtrC family decaheme c-type cytochrome [Gammaproteobacteria bacterium]|nr:OmcA/MtrC family decaheme c-type cytochrome [Gammaproteobacteria bacterium]
MSFSDRLMSNRATLLSALLLTSLIGCGGGDGLEGGAVTDGTGNGTGGIASGTTVALADIQSGLAKLDSSDSSAAFTSYLPTDVSAVSINGSQQIRFVLKDTHGRVVTGLEGANIRVALAKLVPGTRGLFGTEGTGDADQWVSYIYRTKSGTAITDGVQATYESGTSGTLTYDQQNKYYSYTFATNIQTVTRPDDLATPIWDEAATHRVAIQLELKDNNGNRILLNPHFDFTFSGGESVALADTAQTHKVADESSCNQCHNQLTAHGGRVEVEYCVMCHNPGSVDVEFGSPLDFKVMIHKIHAGKSLVTPYNIAGYGGTVHEWSDVGYPQDLRNCSKCHDGANPLTPQGENWNQKPTQQACSSCHETVDFNNHRGFDMISALGVADNSRCIGCHAGASQYSYYSIKNVHWNQLEENARNYQFNIVAFSYDDLSREATVTYSITNPNDDSAYDLTEGLVACMADVTAGTLIADDCRDLEGAPFSRFSLYIGALTVNGVADDYTDHSATTYAWQGTDNADGTYTTTLTVPAEAKGTARLLSSGQAQERKIINYLLYSQALDNYVEITAANAAANGVDWDWANRVRVPVTNVHKDFSVDGSVLNERRVVVDDAKCNSCHGKLGTASGSNTLANAFHRGERSSVVACPVCHTPNRASSTEMSDELVGTVVVEPLLPDSAIRMNQSYEFKTMIHAIHGGEERATAYMHGTDNLSGDTHYPGILKDCTTCHVDDSYTVSAGKLAAAVTREADISQRRVISPNAAACMGCHDKAAVRDHMSQIGGASIGDFTQQQWLSGAVYEGCGECHGASGAKSIKTVHHIE